jgi:hypothetical protein
METDLFTDWVLKLDESFKKIRKITKKFESSQFGFKCSEKKNGNILVFEFFLGFEPVAQ